jgi:hypothetical protein
MATTTISNDTADASLHQRRATRRRPYHLAAAVLLLLANLVTALSCGVPLVADALTLNQDYSAATQLATADVTYANTQSALRAYVGSGLASDLAGYRAAAAGSPRRSLESSAPLPTTPPSLPGPPRSPLP